MTVKELKQICLNAQRIHEESFMTPTGSFLISKKEAAVKAVDNAKEHSAWYSIVYFLISGFWNDIQEINVEK